MADSKLYTVTNTQDGARGIWSDGVLSYIEAGQSVPAELTDEDKARADKSGYFDIVGGADPEPGPLDGSVEELTAYLETVTDPAEVQKLLDAEKAGKSRKGATAALEARRDALAA